MIKLSAAHIYLSALPFVPQNSLVRQTFSELFVGLPSIETLGIDYQGGRCRMVLAGHEEAVNCLTYSPDGKVLASGSGDATVRLWDTLSGAEIQKLTTSTKELIRSIAFTPDGRCLVAGTSAGSVIRWDSHTGRLLCPPLRLRTISVLAAAVHAVSLSWDGRYIASSEEGMIGLWSTETGRSLCGPLNGHNGWVWALSVSRDGKMLASGGEDSTVCIWDCLLGRAVGELLRGYPSAVRSLAFSHDGLLLASGCSDGPINVWHVQTRQQLRSFFGHQSRVCSVSFAPDGHALASASDDTHVRIWNLHGDEHTDPPLILRGHSKTVNAVCFSNEGLCVASCAGGKDDTIRVWDLGRSGSTALPQDGHTDRVNSIAVSADSSLIASASEDGTVRVWDAHTCEQMYPPLVGHARPVRSVVFSSDGVWIATGSFDTTVRLWDARTGQFVQPELRGHDEAVNSVAFSPNGLHLASGSDDRTIRIWDVSIAQPVQIERIECDSDSGVCCIVYTPDGRSIVAGDAFGGILAIDATTGQQTRLLNGSRTHGINSLGISPDGARVVAGLGREIVGFDIGTGKQVFRAQGHNYPVDAVAYSLHDSLIASGASDRTIRLWNANSAQAIDPILRGHAGDHISSVVFSQDGRLLVTGGDDMTIRLWDLQKVRTLVTAQRERNSMAMLAFAPFKNGWLMSPTNDLLLWVPPEYRERLEVGGHSRIIATHRVVVTADDGVMHQGEQWTRCWRNSNLK